MREWRPTLGAISRGEATTFTVWSPGQTAVDLVVDGAPRPLTHGDRGYWSGTFADARPGTRYKYRLSGRDDLTFPDPASRFQPEGVHGPSEVIAPAFPWSDDGWRAPGLERLVFYELHVGTFTPEGSFQGVRDHLAYLRDLGVTAIELMPVGDFPGDRNWGYDGVAIFAPARCYGRPDALRALVDEAHRLGLAVFLDVVYNHFGPDGAYANAFSPHYFTDRHRSPWGRGVNLDGPHSAEVRRFFIENALHWVHEYHLDGLRLDATHALQDESPTHFLAELTTTVRDQAMRPVIFVAEDHRNLASLLRPVADGGLGLDAVWADDFHHQARVHTARDSEGYYADFSGTATDLATTVRKGWFFTGQHSQHLGEARGTDPAGVSPTQFVVCIQNHDQIGNRALGERLNHEVDAPTFRALSTLLLMAPETPLIFMGQEWAASSPFLFFTDHEPDLGRRVTEGRRGEFGAFAAFADPVRRCAIPDPQDAATFARSRLDWAEAGQPPHVHVRTLYTRLLQARAAQRALAAPAPGRHGARAVDAHAVMVTLRGGATPSAQDLTVVVRLSGGPGTVALPGVGRTWRDVILTTEDEDVCADPRPIRVETTPGLQVIFERPGAIVFRGVLDE